MTEKSKKSKSQQPGLAATIDHTILKPEATEADIRRLCQEAIEYGFKGVCVNSSNIALVAELLQDKDPLPVAVVGFPLGASVSIAKAFEAREAIKAGAKEIDMVLNIGALKARNFKKVLDDIQMVVDAAAPIPVKVILETCYLDADEKIIACALSSAAGAAFVKTSTGFGTAGASEADIALMKRIVGDAMGIKAAGGIKTKADAEKMIAAGATRIGASASVEIVSVKENQ